MTQIKKPRRKRWAVSVGVKGRNRVRVYEHVNGRLYLAWQGGSQPLLVDDRLEAVQLAEQKAQLLLKSKNGVLTLGVLFDMYLKEVASKNRSFKQRVHAFGLMQRFWGEELTIAHLDQMDVNRYMDARRSGKLTSGHQWSGTNGCGDRTLENEISGLLAALNWATTIKDKTTGEFRLLSNPLRGFKKPKEKNPQRPQLVDGEYEALLAVADQVDWRFKVALVLCYETGHRIGSVRQLRWSDIDLDNQVIRWEATSQKNGHTHFTPLTDAAVAVLKEHPQCVAGGVLATLSDREVPLLPSSRDRTKPLVKDRHLKWWDAAVALAGLTPSKGKFHKLRRAFATSLIDQPLRVVQELGGWKNPTVLTQMYQTVSVDRQRDALQHRGLNT